MKVLVSREFQMSIEIRWQCVGRHTIYETTYVPYHDDDDDDTEEMLH